MAFVNNNGCKIFFESFNLESDKIPLFFIHGFAVNSSSFNPQREYFKKKNYPFVVMDVRGHGHSDVPFDRDEFSFDKVLLDIKLVLSELNLDKIILVGHSMGGMISLLFTLKFSDFVEKLVLISTSCRPPDSFTLGKISINGDVVHKNVVFKKIYDKLLEEKKSFSDVPFEDYPSVLKMSKLFYGWKILRSNSLRTLFFFLDEIYNFDVKDSLSNIEVDTLILFGNSDPLFSRDDASVLNHSIKKSNLKIHDGEHSITMTVPSFVNNSIAGFVDLN